jgi:hypothetical protein
LFNVTWFEATLDRLADFYVAVTPEQRQRMAAGIDALNASLRLNPMEVGESRADDFRVAFAPLIIVGFHVDLENRTVDVTSIRRFGS